MQAADSPLALLRPAHGRPVARCVVFPHAGAGPMSYRALAERLPDRVEVVGLTLPGRDARSAEAVPDSVHHVAAEVVEALDALPALVRQVFYGHSMGASLALACAVACHLAADAADAAGAVCCDALVTSAGLPGGSLRDSAGRPPVEAAAAELFSQTVAAAGRHLLDQDVRLARSAIAATAAARVDIPVTALAGTDDPLVPASLARGWGRHTSGSFDLHEVEGHHFFPFSRNGRQAVARSIADALTVDRRLPVPV